MQGPLNNLEIWFERLRAAADHDEWRVQLRSVWDLGTPPKDYLIQIAIARDQAGIPIAPALILVAYELGLKLRHFHQNDRAGVALGIATLALSFSEVYHAPPGPGPGGFPAGPARPDGGGPRG